MPWVADEFPGWGPSIPGKVHCTLPCCRPRPKARPPSLAPADLGGVEWGAEASESEDERRPIPPVVALRLSLPRSTPKDTLAIHAQLKYWCTECGHGFRKWSLCEQHLLAVPECRPALHGLRGKEELEALQGRCRQSGPAWQ